MFKLLIASSVQESWQHVWQCHWKWGYKHYAIFQLSDWFYIYAYSICRNLTETGFGYSSFSLLDLRIWNRFCKTVKTSLWDGFTNESGNCAIIYVDCHRRNCDSKYDVFILQQVFYFMWINLIYYRVGHKKPSPYIILFKMLLHLFIWTNDTPY